MVMVSTPLICLMQTMASRAATNSVTGDSFAEDDFIEFHADTMPDFIDDWTDGVDVFDTGSTNNFTLLEVGDDVETLTVNQNYGFRGALANAVDFTFDADGADVLIFKAANVAMNHADNLFFHIDDGAGNLTSADFL